MKRIPETGQKTFTKILMRWNRGNTREMPWKGEKDPYRVWLSEIILQQTRVEQGTPYYQRFIQRYPTIEALSNAHDQEVFRLWQGLGYYNRCKNMLAAARMITAERQGRFPDTYEDILRLSGVGEYTAAAIASFAFGLPHAVVDGNVQRVLARFFGIRDEVNSTAGKKSFARLAGEVLDRGNPGIYNQAIMDFGATVCTPQQPSCPACPMGKSCYAAHRGLVADFPVKAPKARPRERFFHYLVFRHGELVYLRKRGTGDIWQNLYEFPLLEERMPMDEKQLLGKPALRALSGSIKSCRSSGNYRQRLTHQIIHAKFLEVKLKQHLPDSWKKEYFPVQVSELSLFAFPAIIVQYIGTEGCLQ